MTDSLYKILVVALGGGLGSVMRYLAVKNIDARLNSLFPYGTLTVNVIGSFLLGVIISTVLKKTGVDDIWRIFLGVGFCGGFTTFSAFAYENFNLLDQKLIGLSVLYISVSVVSGIVAMGLGVWFTRFL